MPLWAGVTDWYHELRVNGIKKWVRSFGKTLTIKLLHVAMNPSLPLGTYYQHNDVPVVPEPVLEDEDEDPEEDKFEEEEDPQEDEHDMEMTLRKMR
ncbi:hypothetical protein Tco_0651707 [Tanacetum coccineum]|uniref:Uncharacterized protein n=1 Tax=Tanacetum coccineum TaxID=301880 RepID=A0ABQ4WVJ0_9ASTR